MLYEFIQTHRGEVVERSKGTIAKAHADVSEEDVRSNLPSFLDDVTASLREHDEAVCGTEKLCREALRHGEQRLRLGFTLSELIEDYGAVCQAILSLAAEHGLSIAPDEYAILERCLDAGIASAVEAYSAQREQRLDRSAQDHLGFIAHELRNSLATATLAFSRIRRGDVDGRGKTGAMVDRNLARMREMIDRSLTEARLRTAAQPKKTLFRLCDLLDEIEESMAMEAASRNVRIHVEIARPLVINADQQLLASAAGNLVQNALKFTKRGSTVTIHAGLADDRSVMLEVEDECGGLPTGKAEELFRPYVQRSANHSGVGLGLAIVQQVVEAHGGQVHVRSIPEKGCAFTIRLPPDLVYRPEDAATRNPTSPLPP